MDVFSSILHQDLVALSTIWEGLKNVSFKPHFVDKGSTRLLFREEIGQLLPNMYEKGNNCPKNTLNI